jgi:hypothetical protein
VQKRIDTRWIYTNSQKVSIKEKGKDADETRLQEAVEKVVSREEKRKKDQREKRSLRHHNYQNCTPSDMPCMQYLIDA